MDDLKKELATLTSAEGAQRLLALIPATGEEAEDVIEQCLHDIKQGKSLEVLESEARSGKIGWKHPSFDALNREEQEQNEFITNPIVVEEGVLECRKCSSRRVFSFTKQSRGADESTTVYARCVECNSKWHT